MALLSVQNAGKGFGDRTLFSGVSFEVDAKDKIGLVGGNGCGKTTLLRILTGNDSFDTGGAVRSQELRLGYMAQHACADGSRTLWDEVLSVFEAIIRMEHELEDINRRLAGPEQGDTVLIERQHRLTEDLSDSGGLTYRSRTRAALAGLGFDDGALGLQVSALSGGQRSKAAMCRLLLSDANLLLLDEPTNHLDIPSVRWLEEYLRAYNGAAIIVSHDRYFLDRVTSRTFEIDTDGFYITAGNYTTHRDRREQDRVTAEKHYTTAIREAKRMEEMIARFRQFNREKSVRAAESKQKALDKMMADVEKPQSDAPVIRFDFSVSAVGGNEVLEAHELAMGFPGNPLFSDVNFLIRRGDRVFLLGPNGCGKTTLLRILCGQLQAQSGSIRFGTKVSVGYYDQNQSGLDENKSIIDEVWDDYPDFTRTELGNALASFLFKSDDVYKPISMLSGGERARVLLLKLMLARDNLLLLDEPTNHLDIASREALEEALIGYNGTLFIVSHDRYFINRMANRVMWLDSDGCKAFDGNYDTYFEKTQIIAPESVPVKSDSGGNTTINEYKLKKERESAYRKLSGVLRRQEEAIATAEAEIEMLHERLSDPETAVDYEKLSAVTEELNHKTSQLDLLIEEWEKTGLQLQEMKNYS